MSKRIIVLFTVYLLLPLVLSGCWDYVEYEDLAQITVFGTDYNPQSDEITVTIQYPSIKREKGGGAGGAESGGPQWVVYSATAKNTIEAITKLQNSVPQKLFYGYIKIFIVGEEMAKYKFRESINLIDRTPVMRSSGFIALAEGKAEDVIKTIDPSQLSSGDKIYKLIQLIDESGTANAVTVNEIIEDMAIGGLEPAMPVIKSEEASDELSGSTGNKESGKSRQSQGGQETSRSHKEHPGTLRIDGMAAFQGDKLVGRLNTPESRGLMLIRGKKMHAFIVSDAAGEAGVEQLYFRILESKSAVKVRLENGQPTIAVNVKVKADLRKYYGKEGSDIIFAEALAQTEEKLTESIREDIEAALKRGQRELRTDIFGFGFALYRKYPRSWKENYAEQWTDLYPEIPVTVQVEAKVVNTGINIRKLFNK